MSEENAENLIILEDLLPTGEGRFGSVQEFIVPRNGRYRIEAVGAQGGTGARDGEGGRGARISSNFNLQAGEILHIAVGHHGIDSPETPSGGGGTFLAKKIESYRFLQLSNSQGLLPEFSPLSVESAKIRSIMKIDTQDNIRLVDTPNDESFSIYISNRRMSFNSYWASMHYNSDLALLPIQGWAETIWDIDFLNGVIRFLLNGQEVDSWSFSPFEVPVSSLNLFSRGNSNIFDGKIRELDIEIDGTLFSRYRAEDFENGVLQDSSGNERNVSLSGTVIQDEEDNYLPLLVAGGGGGFGVGTVNVETYQERAHAHLEEWGKDGYGGSSWGSGGVSGGGGGGASSRGQGGGGFFGNAEGGSQTFGGISFVNGALGGNGNGITDGGFGGGGAVDQSTSWGATGGGGGYSGGGGAYSSSNNDSAVGGGGGSFSAGIGTEGEPAFNVGHGYLRIFVPAMRRTGRAVTEGGSPVDYVVVFSGNWDLASEIIPDSSGNWEFYFPTGIPTYITYLAAEHQPKTHGPYVFEEDQ